MYTYIIGEKTLELNYVKDKLFDLINEWDLDVLDILADDSSNLFWAIMGDGGVFRIHCEKESFHLFKPST